MRQVALDTETTGIGHEQGHRIIEIGCVELINRKLTGRHFQVYLNPERKVDIGAFKVHGISDDFLKDKPLFKDTLREFIEFIDDAELIIHNAPFDIGFLNSELKIARSKNKIEDYCKIFDTLVYAREKHPGLRNNLDALCKRYEIVHKNRDFHGALLDAEILAIVYLAMTGGQGELFSNENDSNHLKSNDTIQPLQTNSPVIYASQKELAIHHTFIEKYINPR